MDIPYYIFGIIYLIALLIFFAFAFTNIYHMVRFGFFDFVGRLHTLLLTAVIAVVLFFTILLLKDIDWLGSFTIFEDTLNSLGGNFEL